MRAPQRPGGGGRGRDASRSPPKTTRYHQRSEWPRPNSSRRNQTPPTRDHPRRDRLSPSRAHRCSASIEEKRRDYASTSLRHHQDSGKQKQPQYEHIRPLLPPQSQSNRSTLGFDAEGGGGGGGGYDNIHQKYLLDDPRSSNLRLESDSRPYQAVGSKDFRLHQVPNGGVPSSSPGVGLDGQGMLVQKSMHLDDGSLRTFFMLPPEHGHYLSDTAAFNSKSIGSRSALRLGVRGNDELQYHEHMRGSYDEGEKQKMHSRDLGFPLMPFSQSKAFIGSSSSGSGLKKDDVLASNQNSLRLSPAGFGTSSDDSKFRYHPLGHNGYTPLQPFDPAKRGPPSPPVRDEPRGYSYYSELGQRERSEREFLSSDYPYKMMQLGPHGNFREMLGPGFVDSFGDKMGEAETSPRKVLTDSSLWQHRFKEGDAALNYHSIRSVHEEYPGCSGNGPIGFRTKSSPDCEFAHVVERHDYGRLGYRGRSSSPIADRYVDIYKRDVSPPRGRVNAEDIGKYDSLTERIMERNYIKDDDMNVSDPGSMLLNSWNASEGIRKSNGGDKFWASKERVGVFPSKRLGYGRSQFKTLSRRVSGSDDWVPSRDSTVRLQGVRGNLKKRLRPGYSDFHGPLLLDRGHHSHRPYKVWKNNLDDPNDVINAHDEDILKGEVIPVKKDPPENSEEFKHQVHKAFLRFSKVLNENQRQRKIFREQGKAGSLSCYVCGSTSKEFVDTHSLVTHAFNSLKVGLRTDHLGLHKALCVLMDWNWQVPPDTARAYQSQSILEAKTLKEDLILWPPVVIIHNSSIGNRNITGKPKVVSIEDMEKMLRGMGYGAGKTRVCRGKPANQSILLVKFNPTFSGLQEAERLHKHYADNNRGRKEFQEVTSNKGSGGGSRAEAAMAAGVEELLYGHMGIAEDLEKLDSDTKKRCLVKSKKDIEAIADAPLATD